jgi:hypothetical protein
MMLSGVAISVSFVLDLDLRPAGRASLGSAFPRPVLIDLSDPVPGELNVHRSGEYRSRREAELGGFVIDDLGGQEEKLGWIMPLRLVRHKIGGRIGGVIDDDQGVTDGRSLDRMVLQPVSENSRRSVNGPPGGRFGRRPRVTVDSG